MNFSQPTEQVESNFPKKEVFLGKVAYRVIAVNPNKEQLKAINQYVPDEEPVYTGKREINGQEFNLANVTVYLQNVSNNDIVDRVTYSVIDNVQLSATNKLAAINKYGNDAWIEESHINAKTLPSNMEWFLNEGIKPAKRGEKELVRFIRALRNFKTISNKSTQEEKDAYVSLFEEADLQKLFKGDFSDIRSILMANPESKVGFLLGARTTDEGKVYQDMYKEYPLRSYMINNDKSDEYLIKDVISSQENSKYANTYFDVNDTKYKKYDVELALKPSVMSAGMDGEGDDLPF